MCVFLKQRKLFLKHKLTKKIISIFLNFFYMLFDPFPLSLFHLYLFSFIYISCKLLSYFSIGVSNDGHLITSLANFQLVKSLLCFKIFQIFKFIQS